MTEYKIFKLEIKFMPRVWLALGWIDGGIVFGAFGLFVKVGRR